MTSMPALLPGGGPALAVVGASGGCGATTLAAVLAAVAGRDGRPCCAVDLQAGGGGLDVPYAVEHLAGLRWSDLADVDGPIDGPALMAGLPAAGPVRILAHPRDATPVPGTQVQADVVAALRGACALLVADAPRGAPERLLARFDLAVVVSGDGVLELSALAATARRLSAGAGDVVLVLRSRRRSRTLGEELGRSLGLPVVGWLSDDPRVPRNLRRGHGPVTDGPVARLAAKLLEVAVTSPERAP